MAAALHLPGAMLVYRAFALGLLGACCLLLAMRPPIAVVVPEPGPLVLQSPHEASRCPPPVLVESGPTILDVAPGVTPSQLADLIVLAEGETIVAIDDVPVRGSLGAGVALAGIDLQSRRYLDLAVAGEHGTRRLLVLQH